MKILFFVAAFIALSSVDAKAPLLGAKECTWGPSYWCKNLTSAASCHATKHCIQTDWMHRQLPPDNSNICQTCLDMVKQARDQLLSNETQELIKEVFEGTCKLIHFKPVVKECDKIVDNFIPDLIDTLASEMNPQVVCSVAGLCNNQEYLKSLEESTSSTLRPTTRQLGDVTPCEGCQTVVSVMEKRFNSMSKDEVLHGFLMMCRHTGSLSDACSNIILTYFTEIYDHIKEHLNPGEVCILSGECSALYHRHDEPQSVQITPISNIGFVPVGVNDDLTCEFCEQLVKHLRDLLVANTTEEEFKKVLESLCRQTRSFSDECVGLVDQYYEFAYQFLIEELNGTAVCAMVGICPRGSGYENIPIVPLLPYETADALEISPVPKKPTLARVPLTKNTPSIKIIYDPPALGRPEDAQLPIDLLMPDNNQLFNKQVCEFCQFFLHYVQLAITDPRTEEQIKSVVDKACNELPTSINQTCRNFVDTYEPALVSLLAQEIDPSEICPLVRACPSEDVRDVDVFMQEETGDNSKCPLCLFAVTKLEEMVKDNKTEAEIKAALDKLCTKLPKELSGECQAFVDTYTDQLVGMLIADLNPQEVCVYLKLCTDNKPAPPVMKPLPKPVMFSGQIDTNAILDNTYDGVIIDIEPFNKNENVGSIQCYVCKKVMELLLKEVSDMTDEQVLLDFFKKVCPLIPDVDNNECADFIQKYGDTIIKFLRDGVAPEEICSVMQICGTRQLQLMRGYEMVYPVQAAVKANNAECILCKIIMQEIDNELKTNEQSLEDTVRNVCQHLPDIWKKDCTAFVRDYGDTLIQALIQVLDPNDICPHLKFCIPAEMELKTEGYEMVYPVQAAVKANNAECIICKIIMQEIDNELKTNEQSLEDTVRNVCQHLPDIWKKDCTAFVRDYGDTIIQALIQVLEPNDICPYLKLCKPKEMELKTEVTTLPSPSFSDDAPKDDCYMCKRISWAMSKILSNPKTQHDMKHVLAKTCRAIPVRNRKQCQDILERKGKDIYNLLIHKSDKRTICVKVGLCKKAELEV